MRQISLVTVILLSLRLSSLVLSTEKGGLRVCLIGPCCLLRILLMIMSGRVRAVLRLLW